MSMTDEQIEAARTLYVRGLPQRGVAAPLNKPDNRTTLASLAVGFDGWVDSLVAAGRAQLEADAPNLSAQVDDAELREMLRAVFVVWGG